MSLPVVRAYVDESSVIRGAIQEYLICAVLVSDIDRPQVRESVVPFLLKGQLKFHWKDERDIRRRAFLVGLSRLSIEAIVVVHRGPPQRHQERHRRKCLELLYAQLGFRGISRIVFETRTRPQDARDISHMAGLKSARLHEEFLIEHCRGGDEPILWISDAILGAVNARLKGFDVFESPLRSVNLHMLETSSDG